MATDVVKGPHLEVFAENEEERKSREGEGMVVARFGEAVQVSYECPGLFPSTYLGSAWESMRF
jgi:hypothetical protein